MKRLALAIQTYPGGNLVLARHWENFKKAGADHIVTITTTCGKCVVPEGIAEPIGADLYITGKHLCLRLLRTFQHLRDTKCDWFAVLEYDVLVLKPFPRDLPEGFTAHMAGGKPAGCHCNFFVHSPWICDRDTADLFVKTGYEILSRGVYDQSPDCFAGQIIESAKIPLHTEILKSYSQNTIGPDRYAEARAAVDAGAYCVHGVKSAECFEVLTR